MNYWPVEIVNLSELHTPLKNLVKDFADFVRSPLILFMELRAGWLIWWRIPAALLLRENMLPGEPRISAGPSLGEHFAGTLCFHTRSGVPQECLSRVKRSLPFFPFHDRGTYTGVAGYSSLLRLENAFYMPGTRKGSQCLCWGRLWILRLSELFSNTIQAARLLEIDAAFADSLEKALTINADANQSERGIFAGMAWRLWRERILGIVMSPICSVCILRIRYPWPKPRNWPKLPVRHFNGVEMEVPVGRWLGKIMEARLQEGDKALELLKNLLKPVWLLAVK